MKTPHLLRLSAWSIGCISVILVRVPTARASEGITAVYSRVADDYSRATLPNGSFENESYVFGNGGYYGAAIHDDTIDNLTFSDVAHTIAESLAAKNYVTSRDPNATKLLIMVYWGATDGALDFASVRGAASGGGRRLRGNGFQSYSLDSAASAWGLGTGVFGTANTLEAMTDSRNASLLGYMDELNQQGSKARRERSDLLEEVGYSRYFVVLMAYDFQLMWKHKTHKLLWESRFSVREQGNDFTLALPAMAKYASDYFGQDSHGLLRTRVPDARIYMGDPTVVGYLADRSN
jgi:hypothetical protein